MVVWSTRWELFAWLFYGAKGKVREIIPSGIVEILLLGEMSEWFSAQYITGLPWHGLCELIMTECLVEWSMADDSTGLKYTLFPDHLNIH